MGRKSASCDFQKGLICRRDDRKFFRIYESLAESELFCNLTPAAQLLYIHMGLASGGKIEFEFPHARYSKIMSSSTFQAAKKQLIEAGFLTETVYRCRKNRYKFSSEWMNKKMPSTAGESADGKAKQ